MSYFRTPIQTAMRHLSAILLMIVLVIGTFTACHKTEEYIPVPYDCKCGKFTWRGTSFDLLDANYILADSTVMLSRKYYITADVQGEDEDLTHTVSMTIDIANVGSGLFYIDADEEEEDDFAATVYERNDNAIVRPFRTYRPIQGLVQVSPAFLGGPENVQFNLILKEVDDNGNMVGFEFSFTGTFKVNVGY
jgi:hypothetical protein